MIKRQPVQENDIPDIIERFHKKENEEDRERTEQSFMVDKQEIIDYLKKEYYVSTRKGKLAIKVAENEKRLLEKIDYNNGYSLYAGIPVLPDNMPLLLFHFISACGMEGQS